MGAIFLGKRGATITVWMVRLGLRVVGENDRLASVSDGLSLETVREVKSASSKRTVGMNVRSVSKPKKYATCNTKYNSLYKLGAITEVTGLVSLSLCISCEEKGC